MVLQVRSQAHCSNTSRRCARRSTQDDPLGRLARHLGDAVEVFVVVPDDGPGQLGDGGDEEIRDLHAAMVKGFAVRELPLHVEEREHGRPRIGRPRMRVPHDGYLLREPSADPR
jgi:hypothetical protein